MGREYAKCANTPDDKLSRAETINFRGPKSLNPWSRAQNEEVIGNDGMLILWDEIIVLIWFHGFPGVKM